MSSPRRNQPKPKPREAETSPAVFDQHRQTVHTQWNVAGNTTIDASSPETLARLIEELGQVRKTRSDVLRAIENEFGTVIPMVGHVGDGNIHPTLIKSLAESDMQNLKKAKREIYKEALKLGGTMTAEHGVGKIRIPDVDIFLDKKQLELMRGIKQVFDPNGILNPGCAVKSYKK
jgi:FAD/FMN-containing dehydrogenase